MQNFSCIAQSVTDIDTNVSKTWGGVTMTPGHLLVENFLFMTVARVHINFVAKSERPSLTSLEDIAIIQNRPMCRTPIRGHARGQKWYQIPTVGFPISVQ